MRYFRIGIKLLPDSFNVWLVNALATFLGVDDGSVCMLDVGSRSGQEIGVHSRGILSHVG